MAIAEKKQNKIKKGKRDRGKQKGREGERKGERKRRNKEGKRVMEKNEIMR